MGFLDKVKEQAATATAAAKDAAQKGQAKLDNMQANKAADGLLRDLGAAVYAQQTGRATDQTAADIERLMGQLRDHEQAYGPLQLQPSPATVATSDPAGGYVNSPPTASAPPPAAPAAAPVADPAAGGGTPPPPPTGVSV